MFKYPASDGVKNLSLLSIGLAPNVYHNNLFIDEMYSYFLFLFTSQSYSSVSFSEIQNKWTIV